MPSHKHLFFFFVVSFSLFITNCSWDKEYDEVIASVNDSEITVSDFEQKYVGYLIQTGRNDTKEQRYQYLNELIDKLVMADAALQENYLTNQIYQDAIWYQERKTLSDVYFVDQMNERLEEPTEEDVRLAFAKSKRKVYVRHLFSKDQTLLFDYYQRLKSGEDFVDLANEFYQTAEYDSSAGYLGPISYYGIDENFAETAFSLNEGEFSEPTRTNFGYHIIYIEKVLFEALLTESEFQTRRPGIESKVKQRNQALTGDQYVQDLMSKLDVNMNREVLVEVMESIRSLPFIQQIDQQGNQGNTEGNLWNDQRIGELNLELDNDAVLGSYVLLGERIEFTVQDYLDWLPYLPLAESKNRTGASVGKALRNEVLKRLATAEGYKDDERVQKKVKQRGQDVLAELYQKALIEEALKDTLSVNVPEEFKNRVTRDRTFKLEASYWKIETSTYDEANLIRNEILNGNAAQSYPGFQSYNDVEITRPEADFDPIARASLGTPLTVKKEPVGYMVLFVEDRELIEASISEADFNVEKMYKVIGYLNTKIDSMRTNAEISVDTTLFNNIYEL